MGLPKLKIPKAWQGAGTLTLAQCADRLYKVRQERLEIQKQVDALQSFETQLKDRIIAELPKSEASGVAGKVARVQLTLKPTPRVENWEAFYKYIKKTSSFHLLNRAPNAASVKELWDDGKVVPGVERFNAIVVSCTKLEE